MKATDWISVVTNLPEIDTKVLACTSNGKVMITSMYIPQDIYGNILGEKEWHGSSKTTASITHWMPIVLPVNN